MDIVINWSLVTAASVILGFILNQVAAWAGLEISQVAKKGVVFAVALALSGYFAYSGGFDLPDPAADPAVFALALGSIATSAFKVAQQVYDRFWVNLVAA
jgi:hypothetical protein